MPRIALRELEEALRNPTEYRTRLLDAEPRRFVGGPSYFGALRDTILYKFHRPNADLIQVRQYLNERLASFRDQDRIDDIIVQFEWYIDEYVSQDHQYFETASRINVPLPPEISPDITCSGEVSRLDVVSDSGYAAWIFRRKDPEDWFNELRMPLTQLASAHKLAVAPRFVSIGIYSFEERVVEEHSFSDKEIANALNRVSALIEELGLG